jgi:2-dehydro-3-deoxygalactonokinase
MKDLPEFLSCDWGTTSFRLRWVRQPGETVVREVRELAGAKALYEQAMAEGAFTQEARGAVFSRFLREQVERLLENETFGNRPVPLVISGMASSSIGWRELPYAKAPFDLDGKGLRFEQLKWSAPAWVEPTYLLSGVATQHDIMRGEEMEIIGLMSEPSLAAARRECLLILPGTHSKHIWIRHESVIDFRTSMTGELFDVLGKQSLLRASVDVAAPEGVVRSEEQRTAFREGVLWAKERGLAGGLFRVRTRVVLDHRPLSDNTAFFSGLLVGSELRHLLGERAASPVLLGAAGHLSELYATALDTLLGQSKPWQLLPPDQVERATIAGHAIFLRNRPDATKEDPG